MPTYNRFPRDGALVNEAVECFIRQNDVIANDEGQLTELLICNDTPGQQLQLDNSVEHLWRGRIHIINLSKRFKTLGDKLRFMISQSRGDYFCRWDDDDISLPNRLNYSFNAIGNLMEWHPINYFYHPKGQKILIDSKHANVHITAIWKREILERIGGYPVVESGCEDQAFMMACKKHEVTTQGETLKPEDIFYIYRWGVSSNHLSGVQRQGWDALQEKYDDIGKNNISQQTFNIMPHWREDYVKMVADIR